MVCVEPFFVFFVIYFCVTEKMESLSATKAVHSTGTVLILLGTLYYYNDN